VPGCPAPLILRCSVRRLRLDRARSPMTHEPDGAEAEAKGLRWGWAGRQREDAESSDQHRPLSPVVCTALRCPLCGWLRGRGGAPDAPLSPQRQRQLQSSGRALLIGFMPRHLPLNRHSPGISLSPPLPSSSALPGLSAALAAPHTAQTTEKSRRESTGHKFGKRGLGCLCACAHWPNHASRRHELAASHPVDVIK
jgi:hypothetical protein